MITQGIEAVTNSMAGEECIEKSESRYQHYSTDMQNSKFSYLLFLWMTNACMNKRWRRPKNFFIVL